MVAKPAELVVKIGANSEKYRKELSKIEKQTDESVARMQKRASIAAAGFAAAAAGGLAAFNQFADFEASFSNVVTLLDEGSFKTKSLKQGVGDLKSGLLELRASTGESFENLNKGLFDLISAGVDAEQSVKILGTAVDLAKAGATDTSVAVDGLTSALNAYNMESDQAQAVSEKFFTAQKFGKTTIAELSQNFGQVGATAASLGVSLDEVLASVSAATTAGIQTSQAYTGLKAVFANVIKPTKDAATEAERLGIQFDAASLRSKGLKGFLDEITQSAGFNADSLGKLFGSVEALNVATALAGNQADEFSGVLEALADKSGTAATFQDALAVKSSTAREAQEKLSGAIDSAAVKLGEFISPAVITFLDATARSINNATEGFQILGKIISGVATIISETFSASLIPIKNFVSEAKLLISDFVESLQNAINLLPGITVDFGGYIDQLRNDALKLALDADEREKRAASFFFGPSDEEIANSIEGQRELYSQQNELLAEALEERRQVRLDALDEDSEAGLTKDVTELTEEEFEELLEKQKERQALLQKQRDEANAKQTAGEKKAADERKKIEKQLEDAKADRVKAEEDLDQAIVDSSFAALNQIVGDNKAAQTILFLAEKGISIAKILMNAQQAASLAIATLPPPYGEQVAAQRIAMGNMQAGIVAATALPELIGKISANTGGVVPGGFGGGDRVNMLLEPGELIVPKQLAPSFLDIVSGNQFNEGSGTGQTHVIIGFEEDASRYITAKQREDRILGVSQ